MNKLYIVLQCGLNNIVPCVPFLRVLSIEESILLSEMLFEPASLF